MTGAPVNREWLSFAPAILSARQASRGVATWRRMRGMEGQPISEALP
jgi:hypothetical protein